MEELVEKLNECCVHVRRILINEGGYLIGVLKDHENYFPISEDYHLCGGIEGFSLLCKYSYSPKLLKELGTYIEFPDPKKILMPEGFLDNIHGDMCSGKYPEYFNIKFREIMENQKESERMEKLKLKAFVEKYGCPEKIPFIKHRLFAEDPKSWEELRKCIISFDIKDKKRQGLVIRSIYEPTGRAEDELRVAKSLEDSGVIFERFKNICKDFILDENFYSNFNLIGSNIKIAKKVEGYSALRDYEEALSKLRKKSARK